jgi:TfoX/Sxy family transcriptional regulator of competence genes
MAFDEKLADRVRDALATVRRVEEKKMFRGLCFMVNNKMCVSVSGEELMCRIDPKIYEEVLERDGCRPMIRNGKNIEGYVYLGQEAIKSKKAFDYWINQCLAFNNEAKASKKTKKN